MGASLTNHRYPFDLSVVLPVYNEKDNVLPVHDELAAVLAGMDLRYEIIYVDDGSRDGSTDAIRALADARPDTGRAVLLRRNFGQTAAIQAGIDHANGAIIALMDADLQNDPHDIPLMLQQMETEGYDLVSGWRKNRQDRALSRKLPSRIANRLISVVTGVELHDYGCTLKTYRREVLDHVRLYGEMHRFIPVLANAAGARIVERVVNHRPRIHGKSKNGLWRTIKVGYSPENFISSPLRLVTSMLPPPTDSPTSSVFAPPAPSSSIFAVFGWSAGSSDNSTVTSTSASLASSMA